MATWNGLLTSTKSLLEQTKVSALWRGISGLLPRKSRLRRTELSLDQPLNMCLARGIRTCSLTSRRWNRFREEQQGLQWGITRGTVMSQQCYRHCSGTRSKTEEGKHGLPCCTRYRMGWWASTKMHTSPCLQRQGLDHQDRPNSTEASRRRTSTSTLTSRTPFRHFERAPLIWPHSCAFVRPDVKLYLHHSWWMYDSLKSKLPT